MGSVPTRLLSPVGWVVVSLPPQHCPGPPVGGLRKEELGLLNRLCMLSLQDCTFFNKNDILK